MISKKEIEAERTRLENIHKRILHYVPKVGRSYENELMSDLRFLYEKMYNNNLDLQKLLRKQGWNL